MRLPSETQAYREEEESANGDYGAVRQAHRFGVPDIQFFTLHVGGAALLHFAEDKTHVPEGLPQALLGDRESYREDPPHEGGEDKDAEPILPAGHGAHRGHQFDVA